MKNKCKSYKAIDVNERISTTRLLTHILKTLLTLMTSIALVVVVTIMKEQSMINKS